MYRYAAHSIAGRSSDGRDKQNQDAFLLVTGLGGDAEVSLFAVFDGHGTQFTCFTSTNVQILTQKR
jgi:serine/threonine protein phosphatase PrpC